MNRQNDSKSVQSMTWPVVLLAMGALGCASSSGGAEREVSGPAMCLSLEIQNTALVGVQVWIEWEDRAPRQLGRLSISDRDVYEIPFRNAQLNLRFQREGGGTEVQSSNPVFPQPGDRIEIVYRVSGPGPLRRIGTTDCS